MAIQTGCLGALHREQSLTALKLVFNKNITWIVLTEFRQPLQVQSHLEMPRILVQLGHTQRT